MSRPSPAPTIRTIAEAAGLSRTAVSLALRNSPQVSAETRSRIQELAKEMGYRQNPYVSSLMSHLKQARGVKQHAAIALVGSNLRHRNKVQLAFRRGARERAEHLGFSVDEFDLRASDMTQKQITRILTARNIHGVLLMPTGTPRGHRQLNWKHLAAAAIGYSVVRPDLHRACCHELANITEAMRHLRRAGYRRPALMMPAQHDARVSHLWRAGFLSFLSVFPDRDALPLHLPSRWSTPAALKWIRQHKPDVILTTANAFADELLASKLRIPEKVGLVSLIRTSEYPYLAGMDPNFERVAASAIDHIAGQLQRNEYGLPEHPKVTLIRGTWRDGPTVRVNAAWRVAS